MPISAGKRRIFAIAGLIAVFLAVSLIAAIYILLRVPSVRIPEGVIRRTVEIPFEGRTIVADIYVPAPEPPSPAPVALIAHGFTRNRRTMAGWGVMLAEKGFISIVPDLPSLADHRMNSRALRELVNKISDGGFDIPCKASGKVALVGFSAGGFSTLLAAEGNKDVHCWVGLDPVGMGAASSRAAGTLEIPCYVIRAEPAPWNASGDSKKIFDALPGPARCFKVRNASHTDGENPTSLAADIACGGSSAARRAVFSRYLGAALSYSMMDDPESYVTISNAGRDPEIGEVETK